jgi:hypothetical protein
MWGMARSGHRPPTSWLLRVGEHVAAAAEGSRVRGWAFGLGLFGFG